MTTPRNFFSDGPCPFLTCLEIGPHSHPVCPDCGAVRYGNAFCATCVRSWTEVSDDTKTALLEAIERNRS